MIPWTDPQTQMKAIVGCVGGVVLVIAGLLLRRRSRAWSVACFVLGVLLLIVGYSGVSFWFGTWGDVVMGCSIGVVLAITGVRVWHRWQGAAMLSFVIGAIVVIFVFLELYVTYHCGPCP